MENEQQNEPVQQIVLAFGKFKDADALYKAYCSLESEFTKRNQELKSLKGAVASLQEEIDRLKKEGQDIFANEEFIDRAAADEQVFAKAIRRFLDSRSNVAYVPHLTAAMGQPAAVTIRPPKTLEEARRLAEELLK